MNWDQLKHEYGLDGERLLPWKNLNVPFGGAYCVVKKGTQSDKHINEPIGEEELFIGISGIANVWIEKKRYLLKKGDILFIPSGKLHYIENSFEEDFHVYAIWWDSKSAAKYIDKNNKP